MTDALEPIAAVRRETADPADPETREMRETRDYLAFRHKVRGTNINEQTLLATDYLNHFNEIAMMLEMIPDMPEFLGEAREWRPKSYPDHFRDSGFSDKDLAIAAYDHAPARYRRSFEETVARIDRIVALGLDRIEARLADGDGKAAARAASGASRGLAKLIDIASAIIHGGEPTVDQDEIDDLLGGEPTADQLEIDDPLGGEPTANQQEIDELFGD